MFDRGSLPIRTEMVNVLILSGFRLRHRRRNSSISKPKCSSSSSPSSSSNKMFQIITILVNLARWRATREKPARPQTKWRMFVSVCVLLSTYILHSCIAFYKSFYKSTPPLPTFTYPVPTQRDTPSCKERDFFIVLVVL